MIPFQSWSQRSHLLLTLFGAMFMLNTTQAQIQTAGDLLVNVDATVLPTGSLNDITNSGTLGGFFEAKLVTGANAATGTNALVGGVNGIQLSGYCMQLLTGINGALIPPPSGLVGSNATATIEVWALNPGVADDEAMVSWGTRGIAGANMVFDYGNNATFGAVTHTGAADMPWDVNTGAPLNNRWHHLVYTFDGAIQNVYLDGVLINGKATTFNTATNVGIMLGDQWTNNVIANPPAISTLTLARVRIHDGALTASQVQSNFAFEKSTFIPAPIAPQVLAALPVHRYSFSEAPTDNASGLTFVDSIAGANGIVQATNILSATPKFSGSRLVLPGFVVTTVAIGPLAPYGDLPNGLLSVNSTNNGGSGEFSIEIWFKNLGNASSPRVFDIGTMGIGGQPGVELNGVDQFPTGAVGLDYFFYSAQVGASVNQRRLAWQNRDILPVGSSTNAAATSSDMTDIGTYQTDRHMVVTWKESTGQIIAYENGNQVASTVVSNAMSSINDVNIWLGRSVNSISDGGFVGEYDEVRFYTNVLSLPEIVGNFQVGPDTLNTGEQAVALLTQPRSATVFLGAPVSFTTTASGSPAVSYQWRRNGVTLAGATNTVLSLASTVLANNGDAYSCVVSNFALGAPHVVTTTNAILTVIFSQAPPTQFLFATRDGNRDTYNTGTTGGEVGGIFTVGNNSVVVTHLGFYDQNNDGLNRDHLVGIFNGTGTALLGSVTVPSGTGRLSDQWIPLHRIKPCAGAHHQHRIHIGGSGILRQRRWLA